jgi:hypothetical protein
MILLEKRFPDCNMTNTFVDIHYHNVGFPKCLSNRFQNFLQILEEIGYCEGVFNQIPFVNKKKSYIFTIPSEEALDIYFKNRLHEIIDNCVKIRE